MTGPSRSREAAILNADLDSTTYWLGLSTTTPTDTGSNIVEPSASGYARVAVVGSASAWDPAVAGSGTTPTSKASASELTFPVATSDWASGVNMTDFILMSASVTGSMEYSGPLDNPKPVLSGDTARFAVGTLRILLGNVSDSYV